MTHTLARDMTIRTYGITGDSHVETLDKGTILIIAAHRLDGKFDCMTMEGLVILDACDIEPEPKCQP